MFTRGKRNGFEPRRCRRAQVFSTPESRITRTELRTLTAPQSASTSSCFELGSQGASSRISGVKGSAKRGPGTAILTRSSNVLLDGFDDLAGSAWSGSKPVFPMSQSGLGFAGGGGYRKGQPAASQTHARVGVPARPKPFVQPDLISGMPLIRAAWKQAAHRKT